MTPPAVLNEVQVGRRAFPMAQQLLMGGLSGEAVSAVTLATGWYDSSVHPETGSFALVATGAGLDDLIGEVAVVSFNQRRVFVYVLQDATLPDGTQFALARRAFAGVARLSLEVIAASVAALS